MIMWIRTSRLSIKNSLSWMICKRINHRFYGRQYRTDKWGSLRKFTRVATFLEVDTSGHFWQIIDGANVGYYSLRPQQGETLSYLQVFFYLSIYLSILIYRSIHIYLYICLPISSYLSINLSIYTYLSFYLSISIYSSIYIHLHLSICIYICI